MPRQFQYRPVDNGATSESSRQHRSSSTTMGANLFQRLGKDGHEMPREIFVGSHTSHMSLRS